MPELSSQFAVPEARIDVGCLFLLLPFCAALLQLLAACQLSRASMVTLCEDEAHYANLCNDGAHSQRTAHNISCRNKLGCEDAPPAMHHKRTLIGHPPARSMMVSTARCVSMMSTSCRTSTRTLKMLHEAGSAWFESEDGGMPDLPAELQFQHQPRGNSIAASNLTSGIEKTRRSWP